MQAPVLDRSRLRELFNLQGAVYEVRGGDYAADPYPRFHELREAGPVHEGTVHQLLGLEGHFEFQCLPFPDRQHFSAFDFETCAAVLKDDEVFVTNPEPLPGETSVPISILTMDGSQHRRHRRLVQPSFVPSRAVWWRQHYIEQTIQGLVEGFAAESAVDLSVEFCAPVPLLTITGSFGITVEQALDVRALVTRSAAEQALGLVAVLAPVLAARRLQLEDDLISVLVEAELVDDEGVKHRLSDAEIFGFSFLLLAAGSGTTWKQMGITLLALLWHPEALAAVVADRSLLAAAVEESLRWMPTDPVFSRFVARDTELGGRRIPAGSVVHACLGAGNRDASRWSEPDEFDLRRPPQAHLGFGSGPHVCLGAHVARAEMITGISTILDRLPGLRLDSDRPAPAIVGMYERGPTAVPVRWEHA
jgi:cytochrome P450